MTTAATPGQDYCDASPTPSKKALQVFNAYTTVWFVAGAMDSAVTATVYIFANRGFDRDKGDCVNGQLATEATLFALATVAGVVFAVQVLDMAKLWSLGHLAFLSIFAPFYLLVDNNLIVHCSFESKTTREGVLLAFAPLNIFMGIVHVVTLVLLNVPRERDESDGIRRIDTSNRRTIALREVTAQAGGAVERNGSFGGVERSGSHDVTEPDIAFAEVIVSAKRFYNDNLRVATLSLEFAVACDHIMTGVQEIMMYRGYDPESAKCLDGQLHVEISFLVTLTLLGIAIVPGWALNEVTPGNGLWRLFHVAVALVLIPGYVISENSQVLHCYVKGGESTSKTIVLATFNYLLAVVKLAWFLKYKRHNY